jgi:diamine N-acetyltransferase
MLEDNKIRIRAIEPEDLDTLYLWENNPDNWKVSHTQAPYSRQALIQYIESVGDIYSDKQLRLIITEAHDGTSLGAVDLFDCDFKNRRSGIGLLIADANDRGKGLATRVLELILPYCFKTLGFEQVYCNILADNAHSLGLFEKFGFEKVGLKKKWTIHNGDFLDEWLLQKLKTTP